MGKTGGTVAAGEATHREAIAGPPADCERDTVGSANGCSMAGHAGTLREVEDGLQPVSALA